MDGKHILGEPKIELEKILKKIRATIETMQGKVQDLFEVEENTLRSRGTSWSMNKHNFLNKLKVGIVRDLQDDITDIKHKIENSKHDDKQIDNERVKERDRLEIVINRMEDEIDAFSKIISRNKQDTKEYNEAAEKAIRELQHRIILVAKQFAEKEEPNTEFAGFQSEVNKLEDKIRSEKSEIENVMTQLDLLIKTENKNKAYLNKIHELENNLSKERSGKTEIEKEMKRVQYAMENFQECRQSLEDCEFVLMSKEEECQWLNEIIKSFITKGTDPNVSVKDVLLDHLKFEKIKNKCLIDNLEVLERTTNKTEAQRLVKELQISLESEKNKNEGLKIILQIAMEASSTCDAQNITKKIVEDFEKNQIEMNNLKCELDVTKHPTKYIKEMKYLQTCYDKEKHTNMKLQNEIDTIRRQWSMVFKEKSKILPEALRIEHDEISSLKAHIKLLEQERSQSDRNVDDTITQLKKQIVDLKQLLADEAVSYSLLLTNLSLRKENMEHNTLSSLENVDTLNQNKISKSHRKNQQGEDSQEMLDRLKEITLAVCKLGKSKPLNDTFIKEVQQVDNICALQNYQIKMLCDQLSSRLHVDTISFRQEESSTQSSKIELRNCLQYLKEKILENDYLEKVIFAEEILNEVINLREKLNRVDSNIGDIVNVLLESKEIFTKQVTVGSNSGGLVTDNKRRLEETRETFIQMYKIFTQLAQFGFGKSNIMDRFKTELMAMQEIYDNVLNVHPYDKTSPFKKELLLERFEKNVKAIYGEIKDINLFEYNLYTPKKEADEIKYLEIQIREMQLQLQLENNKMTEMRKCVYEREKEINERDKEREEEDNRGRDLKMMIRSGTLAKMTLERSLEKERSHLKMLWFKEGKDWLHNKLLNEEPVSVEGMKIHIQEVIDQEMKVRLELEHEKSIRLDLEEQMSSIHLDIERTLFKSKRTSRVGKNMKIEPCSCLYLMENFILTMARKHDVLNK
uniref:Uncharacterized protein n=1 Tax=Timema bartmani TaxID=61472 RepID=A0A7R9EVB4_9NEOP|nr:unnamed protein product [Timema bartmani]